MTVVELTDKHSGMQDKEKTSGGYMLPCTQYNRMNYQETSFFIANSGEHKNIFPCPPLKVY